VTGDVVFTSPTVLASIVDSSTSWILSCSLCACHTPTVVICIMQVNRQQTVL